MQNKFKAQQPKAADPIDPVLLSAATDYGRADRRCAELAAEVPQNTSALSAALEDRRLAKARLGLAAIGDKAQ
jgi:hypothetical protein